jgi:hypothetical protein
MRLISLKHYRDTPRDEDWVTISVNPTEITVMTPETFEPSIPHGRGDDHLVTGTRIYMKDGLTWLVLNRLDSIIAKIDKISRTCK